MDIRLWYLAAILLAIVFTCALMALASLIYYNVSERTLHQTINNCAQLCASAATRRSKAYLVADGAGNIRLLVYIQSTVFRRYRLAMNEPYKDGGCYAGADCMDRYAIHTENQRITIPPESVKARLGETFCVKAP